MNTSYDPLHLVNSATARSAPSARSGSVIIFEGTASADPIDRD